MSLYSAMLAGVSGLQSNSSALAAIAQNISNVNTIGYKDNQVAFETLVTSSGSQSAYSAGGVTTINQQNVTQQGATTQTASPTDLAITGQGMFVTSNQPATPGPDSQVLFTRAGSFTTDSAGFLKNAAGFYLLGWPATPQGLINPQKALTGLSPINITALSGAVSASTAISVTGNLDSTQTISAAATDAGLVAAGTATAAQTAAAYNPVTNSMTTYDPTAGIGVKPDFTMQIPVSDSLGDQHMMQIDFLKSSTPNQWYAEIQAVPTSDIVSGAGLAPGQIAAGVVAFNPDGSIDMANTTLFGTPTPASPTLSIGASAAGAPGAGAVNWAASLGVEAQQVGVDIAGATVPGGLTQYASGSTVQQVTANGTPFGSLSSITINNDGYVTATFSNGVSRQIAQVAMATFPNEDGLMAVDGDAYQATTTAGAYNLNAPGSGGAGTLTSSALEASTVDLSSEFTNLIITQRAYTASSKIITAADQMTQDLLQIIR